MYGWVPRYEQVLFYVEFAFTGTDTASTKTKKEHGKIHAP
jgi:hypothetical protein